MHLLFIFLYAAVVVKLGRAAITMPMVFLVVGLISSR